MTNRIAIFDAHNHLQDEWLAPYRATVLRDMESVGIVRAVINGTSECDWDEVRTIANGNAWVLPSYGLHPWYLKTRTLEWKERLRRLVDEGGCAIGEIGLDRWIEGFDLADQKEVFQWQLGLAAERNLPVTVHCLKAWGVLHEAFCEQPAPKCGFLLHGYGGPLEMVSDFVRHGAYFSFSGAFLNPGKTERRKVFREIPADRLLVETDAPAMALPKERVRWTLPAAPEGEAINHPANILAVYEGLAELRGWALETLAAQTEENFGRLFGEVIRS